ncbi:AAA family ATPase [Candidatus Woesearchaeota archaeon]|nr:AAA family ATPase [Candidatus Woesearchaeota archaeon]
MLIGLTSFIGAGKGVAAEYFEKKGFKRIPLSDFLREECIKRGLSVTRNMLIEIGNELRLNEGPGVLAKLALKSLKNNENAVIESIRSPEEINELRKRKDFILVSLISSQQIRFERVKCRGRENDPQTFEEFKKLDEREANRKEAHGQKIAQCIELADVMIVNEGLFEELYKKLDQLVENAKHKRLL